MQQALTQDLQAGFAGHPLRQFLRRAAEYLRQVGVEDVLTAVRGRGHSARAEGSVTGYRNGYGHRPIKAAAGPLPLRPPKVRPTAMPVSLALPATLTGMTPELGSLLRRAYVRGRSVRDLAGLDAAVCGGTGSKSAASRGTATLQAEFDPGRARELSDLKVLDLFLDGQFHAARAETTAKEGLLAASALCEDGRRVLLPLGLGPRESTDAGVAFRPDLPARGLPAPRRVVLDGHPGRRKAVRQVCPAVRVQRCPVHKRRHSLAKLPRRAAPQLKPLLQAGVPGRRSRDRPPPRPGPHRPVPRAVPLRHGGPGERPRGVSPLPALPGGAPQADPHHPLAGADLRGEPAAHDRHPPVPRRALVFGLDLRQPDHRGRQMARHPHAPKNPPSPGWTAQRGRDAQGAGGLT